MGRNRVSVPAQWSTTHPCPEMGIEVRVSCNCEHISTVFVKNLDLKRDIRVHINPWSNCSRRSKILYIGPGKTEHHSERVDGQWDIYVERLDG